MNAEFRKLTDTEIEELKENGCRADEWNGITVTGNFAADRIHRVFFQGKIQLGEFKSDISTGDGVHRPAGIYDAQLANVVVGSNSHLSRIGGWLTNLKIADGVVIENVGTIGCIGESTFGNGSEIEVLNEGGGRDLPITRETSSQIAYLNTMYRDRTKLVSQLNKLAEDYADDLKNDVMIIDSGANISNCSEIINVYIGSHARLKGVKKLENGSIESSEEAVTEIGPGVIADNFIIQKGASVKDGAMLSGTLIGEGTKIGKQFSAENSVFFANSEGFHSEACSVFAGPYTVTHHRSTLLIAGMFSFYNAGSGTNQSNHMYKLGPVHQGILERGCKTGSSSYLLWPSRVGAFSAVMGKHYANFDTSDFPFSYIDEHKGKSMLIPGMNFFTVGTMRDGLKWPARDRRKNSDKLDQIIFDVLSPYTIQKMLRGKKVMDDLYASTEKGQDTVVYQGINIKRLLLKTCRRYYQMALDIYFGEMIFKSLKNVADSKKIAELGVGNPDGIPQAEEWIDVAGLLCSRSRMDDLCRAIETSQVKYLGDVNKRLKDIANLYAADEWNWFLDTYENQFGKPLAEASMDDIVGILDRWKSAYGKYLNLVANDAKKEFEGQVRTGYGIDGGQVADFEAVRGNFEDNGFIGQLNDLRADIDKRYAAGIEKIK